MGKTNLRRAGLALRELRQVANKSAVEVEAESVQRWGAEGRIGNHQLSRLENGLIEKPSAQMLCQLSVIYDVPVDELLAIFDFPYKGKSLKHTDMDALARAARLLPRLPAHLRGRILREIDQALSGVMDLVAEDVIRPRWRSRHQEDRDAVLTAH